MKEKNGIIKIGGVALMMLSLHSFNPCLYQSSRSIHDGKDD